MRSAALLLFLSACGAPGAECGWLNAAVAYPAGTGPDRRVPETALLSCVNRLNGSERRVETAPSGAVVAEYGWRDDGPDGRVMVWSELGAFRWSETWEAGVRTARRVVADDGALVELAIAADRVEDLRVLPLGTADDEWEGTRRAPGTRYRAIARPPAPTTGGGE